jgi:hypothetical protein
MLKAQENNTPKKCSWKKYCPLLQLGNIFALVFFKRLNNSYLNINALLQEISLNESITITFQAI